MNRGSFNSNIGFILAASGSAVGLGNIWGFPTMVANNGGGAYVLAYLIMVLLLALPVLITEIFIGYHAQSNQVDALTKISGSKKLGLSVGYTSFGAATLILSFYTIVGGWMIAHALYYSLYLFGIDWAWFTTASVERNLIMCLLFSATTAFIVSNGVNKGIEQWSSRLMPLLFILLIALIIFVALQPGSSDGFKHYLIPDFSKIWDRSLLINAMGQAFFSLSLGVGTMIIYGSYIRRGNNIIKLGFSVAIIDVSIALLAGLLIIPAVFVAFHNGVEIIKDGAIVGGPGIVLEVLPQLFKSLTGVQLIVPAVFFILLVLAAITSSISMLEVPSSVINERTSYSKKRATYTIAILTFVISALVVFNFDVLFDLVITIATQFAQPLLGLIFCIIAGWMWRRGEQLNTLKQDIPHIEQTLFWKIWPFYVKYICPVCILIMVTQSFF